MQKTIKPIDVFVGEASDGHAELVEASLLESGIVKNLYRGRDDTETLALVRRAGRGGKDATGAASLILLDCGLPHIGGVGVLAALKRDQRQSRTPIIMMATEYDRQQAEQCRRLGCDAYMTKWSILLSLSGCMNRIRSLAERAIWGASRRFIVGESLDYSANTHDLRSVSDEAESLRHRPGWIRNEVKDDSVTP